MRIVSSNWKGSLNTTLNLRSLMKPLGASKTSFITIKFVQGAKPKNCVKSSRMFLIPFVLVSSKCKIYAKKLTLCKQILAKRKFR